MRFVNENESKELKDAIREAFAPVNRTILIDELESQVLVKVDEHFEKQMFFDTRVLDYLIDKYTYEQKAWKEKKLWFSNPEFPRKFKKLLKALRYVREDVLGYQKMEKYVKKCVPVGKVATKKLVMPDQKPFTDEPPVFCPECFSSDINGSMTGDLECDRCGHKFREEVRKDAKN